MNNTVLLEVGAFSIIAVEGGYSIERSFNIEIDNKFPGDSKLSEACGADTAFRRFLVASNAPYSTIEEAKDVVSAIEELQWATGDELPALSEPARKLFTAVEEQIICEKSGREKTQ